MIFISNRKDCSLFEIFLTIRNKNTWIGTESATLNKIGNLIKLSRILQYSQIIRQRWYRPYRNIPNIRLRSQVKKLSDRTGENKSHLPYPMLRFRDNKLLYTVEYYEKTDYYGILGRLELLGVIHEGYHPGVRLRNDEIVHIEKYGKFVHWQILPY